MKHGQLERELAILEKHKSNLQAELDKTQSSRAHRLWQDFNMIKKIVRSTLRHPSKLKKLLMILFKEGPYGLANWLRLKRQENEATQGMTSQYRNWINKFYPSANVLASQRRKSKEFTYKPLVSIIIPTYNTPIDFLHESIDSVIKQSYENWELCIADDASTSSEVRKVIKKYAESDSRIKYSFRKKNGHICKASNSALKLSSGEWVALLDHDDILWPNALYEVVSTINQNQDAQFIYSDEDKLEEDGLTHSDPFFKPNWSPDYLRSINYITHFAVIRSDLIRKVGGFKLGTEGAQDWDLFLRATNYIESNSKKRISALLSKQKICHISKILYSWRKSPQSTASDQHAATTKPYAFRNQEVVLNNNLRRFKNPGEIFETNFLGAWFTKYEVRGEPMVSIIIPTKEHLDYIRRCLESIRQETSYSNFEIIIVDTGSSSKEVFDYYSTLVSAQSNIKILDWTKEFNFSAVSNFGARRARGEYLLFLNNDTEVLSSDWMEIMLGYAQLNHAGGVGAKLLYPNMTIQHLGGLLGAKGSPDEVGVAGHAFVGHKEDFRHFDNECVKNYCFVTAACMMIKKDKFDEVRGFDERFEIAFNDVDFGLRLTKKGYFNIIVPQVELIHHESISTKKPGESGRDTHQWHKEIELFLSRWGVIKDKDPFFNINLSRNRTDFSVLE